MANKKQISQILFIFFHFVLFFFLLFHKLFFSCICAHSLFSFSFNYSFPFLPFPLSHLSTTWAVKWDYRLHNMVWGFSFHIIPQTDPKFFGFFPPLTAYSVHHRAAKKRYWDGKWAQDPLCPPKPKENKQMVYVFVQWTPAVPTISPVCDQQTVQLCCLGCILSIFK